MSSEEKVALVAGVQESYGLAPALAAVRLPKSTWYYHQRRRRAYVDKYRHLQGPLERIARQHPEYGYRRTTVELRQAYGYVVNHKVVQRLHKLWDLPLIRGTRRPKPSGIRQAITAAGERANLVDGLEMIAPFEVIYTDFTELVYADGRQRAHLIPILDHTTKVVSGWAVGERAATNLALQAWGQAKQSFQAQDINYRGMIVHHDQDPVFTGYGWTAQLLDDQVRLSYALRGAQDNPEMEAFISRFKEENRSLLLDAQTLDELRAVVRDRMVYYNSERRHSRTEYLAPLRYVEMLQSGP